MPTSTLPHLEVSQALLDEISARADEAERAGNLPLDLVEAMRDAGIFRMMQPTALGGFEIHPAELISIVERLSHADGSTGWIGSIGAGGPAFTVWLDPRSRATCWARTPTCPSRRCSLRRVSFALATGACTTCPAGGRSPADAVMRTGSSPERSCSTAMHPVSPRKAPTGDSRCSRATRARSSTTGTCSACARRGATTSKPAT